ncbi:MAG: TylF/MycF/NovP-related O-methyltransferase [bacterium]
MRIEDKKRPLLERVVHRLYRWLIVAHIQDPVVKQRLKMLWYAPGYWPLLLLWSLPFRTRLMLLVRFLRIDWCVLHGHTPFQCAAVCRALAERPAIPGEAMVEAGCWQGGSSAKWSILCKTLGYTLAVYDSFEGVEGSRPPEGEYDFSGEYAADEHVFCANIRKYGEAEVCRTYRGWFSDTMAPDKISFKVRTAYIDCDTAKGTKEALAGLAPVLTGRASVFSQDCHIPSVLRLLVDPATWRDLGLAVPIMTRIDRRLVRFEVETGMQPL